MLFWRARSHPAPSIDNNPGPAGFQESSVPVSEHSLKRFWQHRGGWGEECRREGTLAHETAVPKQAQNWGQATPHAHKNRSLPFADQPGGWYVLQKPGRANTHRKPPDYLLV